MDTDQGSIDEIDTMNIVSGLDDPQATMLEEDDSENVVQQEEAKESKVVRTALVESSAVVKRCSRQEEEPNKERTLSSGKEVEWEIPKEFWRKSQERGVKTVKKVETTFLVLSRLDLTQLVLTCLDLSLTSPDPNTAGAGVCCESFSCTRRLV